MANVYEFLNGWATTLGGTGLTTSGTALTPASTANFKRANGTTVVCDPTAANPTVVPLLVEYDATTGRPGSSSEIVLVTDTRTVPWTVVRVAEYLAGGVNGTPVAHAAGVAVSAVASSAALESLTSSSGAAAGALLATNNLADVTSPSTSLGNLGGAPTSRLVTAGTGLTGGGDLTADRTLTVSFGSGTNQALRKADADPLYAALPTLRSVTGALTANPGDWVLANANGAAFSVTLPATPATGAEVLVKKTDASTNAVTLVGTVDGVTNPTLTIQNQTVTARWDGAAWRRLTRPALSELVDVSASGVADGQVVAWNAASARWVPVTPSVAASKIAHMENKTGTITTATPPSTAFPSAGTAVDVPNLTYTYAGDTSGRDVWAFIRGFGQQTGAAGTGTGFMQLVETTSGSTVLLSVPAPLPNSVASRSNNLAAFVGALNQGPISTSRSFKVNILVGVATGTVNSTTFALLNAATEPSYLDFELR